MNQYLILFTVGGSPVQFRVINSTKGAQEVVKEFINKRKNARFVAVYALERIEVSI